ncbi:UDP-glucose dehydrogenase family protein [Polynucleobacter victoriensis]|uniref:UDP-glucose 6-dehydrogenase n=1 Tax=Polynucleobacter victoriensis TaxID=2049319 RepID=A0A212T882_9BURK|nr:UDP-glucose/GDP-mannose dehydrogenase family protein [Polynucleobacter victoriensis]SNC62229.1 UDPglucose 6-dehydrogenase [Polynucleobacter victoriensis]
MKITVIGSGYVGLVTGACLAELGNHVFCLDLDQQKIDLLNSGGVPIYEPGLDAMIARNRDAGRIQFSTDIQAAVDHGDIQFIAVGTPSKEDGSADLQHVLSAAQHIGQHMSGYKVIVNKSTVPVGTADQVKATINEVLSETNRVIDFSVVSNPEFLKEGAAIDDFMHPDRIVIGTYEDDAGCQAKDWMRKLYAPFNRHHERTYYMDVRSAELTKYAANAMLATRISFMNELANLADYVGADIDQVRQGIGSDARIGYGFLYAGTGYGGSCFPKDVRALVQTGNQYQQDLKILKAVESVNTTQKLILVRKVVNRYGDDLKGKTFAIWGLSFKPNTDDMREAPSRMIIKELVGRGAKVQAYDPVAMKEAQHCFNLDFRESPQNLEQITLCETMLSALKGCDALILITEWKEFRSPDFTQLKNSLIDSVIFDGRNLYEPNEMTNFGFEYYGVGRCNS